jgi:flavin reductase (DIM6/NTAB) family NADH-FMN oxidoreductase RutF
LDESALRDALATVPAGVVVVSAADERGFRGLTASSFTSVSLQPPLVLVCLDRFAATRDAVAAGRRFNVSLLAPEQEFLADRFAGRAPAVDPAWREVPHELTANGLPVIAGCAAWFACELHQLHEAGDHEIAVGLVAEAWAGGGEPLVHWRRAFWRLGG